MNKIHNKNHLIYFFKETILIVFYMSINIYVYLNIEILYLEIKKYLKENVKCYKSGYLIYILNFKV